MTGKIVVGKFVERQDPPVRLVVSRKDWLIVSLLCAGYAGISGYLSLARHLGLKSFFADTGVYANCLWNLAAFYRRVLGFPFPGTEGLSHLGAAFREFSLHFDPIVFLLAIPYSFFPDPATIYVLQALAIAASGLAIYLIARRLGLPSFTASALTIAYFLYPPLEWAHLYECNLVKFAIPFLGFAVYFWLQERDALFATMLGLAALCKEHLPLCVAMGGILLLFRKKWGTGSFLLVLGLAWFWLNLDIIIPAFRGGEAHAFITGTSKSMARYGWLGNSALEIGRNLITNPVPALRFLLDDQHLRYYSALLLPLLFFPLSRPDVLLLALPGFLANTLSANRMMHSVYFYHSADLIPFLFSGYVLAWGAIFRRGKASWKKYFPILIIGNAFFWNLIAVPRTIEAPAAPSPLSYRFHLEDYRITSQDLRIREIARMVPPEVSLSVQGNLGPHLANRDLIWEFPQRAEEADYVLVGLFNPWGQNNWDTFIYANHLDKEFLTTLVREFESEDREVAYWGKGYLLLHKGKTVDGVDKRIVVPEIQLFLERLQRDLRAGGR